MTENADSTVPRRRLGRMLRDAREAARITGEAAAAHLEVSRHKILRIEKGVTSVRAIDVRELCGLYEVSAEMTAVLVGLAAETKSKGWWHTYGDTVPQWFELFVGLEQAASRLRQYSEALVPGLLQTRDYARAVYQHRSGMTDDEREQLIGVRLQRQELLTRRLPLPPQLDVVLSEAVVRRTIRDRNAMIDQVRHLLEVAELPNVSLRVLPLAAGPHRGAVAGTFVILDFPPSDNGRGLTEPSTVYSESLTGAAYLDKPDELAAYEDVWGSLESLALDRGESTKMITQVIGEIHNE